MQETPKGSRLHIAIFGRCNTGKSSLINAMTNQNVAMVSEIPGTTTDPVYKAMEILPLGPVMLIDTAGIDDEGTLGQMRVEKSFQVLEKADVALLVLDPLGEVGSYEQEVLRLCLERKISVIIVINKLDLLDRETREKLLPKYPGELNDYPCCWVSAVTGEGISGLKQELMKLNPAGWLAPAIVGDLLQPGDMVILVVPIDLAAPKGRLILPQVQTIRDILDHDCITMVCKEYELKRALESLKAPPQLVVTDSQAFMKVVADIPPGTPLTSFSILMARYKGDLLTLARGARAINDLRPGDRVLIAESCTHHQQPDDIGRVKIPRWLRQMVGGEMRIEYTSGSRFPANLQDYRLVVHCGGCMLNRREMLYRIREVTNKDIPIVNYGILIAHIHGILPRALAPLGIVISEV